jgi:hypothetical protein
MCPCPDNGGFAYALLAAAMVLLGVSVLRQHWTTMSLRLRTGSILGLIVVVGLLGSAMRPRTEHSHTDTTGLPATVEQSLAMAEHDRTVAETPVTTDSAETANGLHALPETAETGSKVIAYYFHWTLRCPACLTIEHLAEEIIVHYFPVEIEDGLLAYRAIDAEQPEHLHFIDDYELVTPSLILVKVENGQPTRWKLLEQVWELYEDEASFSGYVQAEVSDFLYAAPSAGAGNEMGF